MSKENSIIRFIHEGVPQERVLGPISYTIYIADMPPFKKTAISAYAFDPAIIASDQFTKFKIVIIVLFRSR